MRLSCLALALLCSCATLPRPVAPPMSPHPLYGHGTVESWAGSPETPLQAALRLWAFVHGPAPLTCVETATNLPVRAVSKEGLEACCSSDKVLACTQLDLSEICLLDTLEGQSYSIRIHEYLHVLVICTGRKEGNTHSDQVWRMVPASELPKISPWYQPWLRALKPDQVGVLP